MLLNRKMEVALENLYKQGKVVGGVYFGLGQEACSCASAYALDKDDWFAPMIRNQGALLVRGFAARDTMMQYMAKADSPTSGRDGTSHFGDIEKRNMVSPISMLGDLIPVLSGVALGARLAGPQHRRHDLHRRRRPIHRRHLRRHQLRRRAKSRPRALRRDQSLGLLHAIRNAIPLQRPRRTRHRIRHPRRDRRWHRRLPGLRRRPRSRRTRPRRRRPHPDRSQNDAHERPRHPRCRQLRSESRCSTSGRSATRSPASKIIW